MIEKPILIVEDEDIMRNALSEWLKDDGFPVESVGGGKEALQSFQGEKYSLVILDVKMPEVDGLTVLRSIKNLDPKVPVIMITAYPSIHSAVESIKLGAEEYIPKPFTPEIIEGAIHKYLKVTVAEEEGISAEEQKEKELADKLAEGKGKFRTGDFKGAIKLLEEVLEASPSKLEARLYIYRARKALEEKVPPKKAAAKVVPQEEKKECIWMKAGVVAYRLCQQDFQCEACEFNQMVQEERMQTRADAKVSGLMEAMKDTPATQRKCRYMLSGKVSYRVCPFLYQCGKCELDQLMQDRA